MTELSSLHVKITGDNSQLKAAVRESIGLTDQFGRSLATSTKASDDADAAAKRRIATLKKNAQAGIAATRATRDLTTGYNAQKLSASQLSAANRAMAGSFRLSGANVAIMTREVRNSRFHTANLAAQFNDIGVMMAAGQSPFILAMQQGTQVSQVFTAMGGTPKDNMLALFDALKRVVSPMSLLTIGAIAGAAALVQWGMKAYGASEDGETFDDKLQEINASLAEGERRIEAYNRGFENVASLAVDNEIRSITEQIIALDEAIKTVEDMGPGLTRSVARQEERLALMREEQNVLRQTLSDLETRNRREEEAEAAYKRNLAAQQAAKAAIEQGVTTITNLVTLAEKLSDAAWDSADGFKAAVRNMGIANLAAEQSQLGRGSMGAGGPSTAAERFEAQDGIFITRDTASRGGGGRGASAANPVPNQLAGLQGELRSPAEQLEAEFAEKQEIMAAALQQELVTKQEHDRMMEGLQQAHSDKMNQIARTEWEAKLAGYAGAFGDLATLANSENQRLAAIGRAAGLIQLGIEGVQAASSAWQKGMAIGGPPVAGAFAAASVLKTAALMGQMRAQNPNPAAAITGGGSGGTAAGAGSSGGGGGGGAAPITSFSFTIQNDPMGYGEAFARQIIDQVNAAQRDGGRVQGFINRA